MNIHEYQAKELMRNFKINVLDGKIARTAEQAMQVAKELGGDTWVVKAQIHAGGRGKAGGVRVAKSPEEVYKTAEDMLGKNLVTHQTGPEGKKVFTLLVEKECHIAHEYYLSLVLDRKTSRLTFVASTEGGVEIEKVCLENPDKIVRTAIDSSAGYSPFVGRKLCAGLGLKGEQAKKAEDCFRKIYDLYTTFDCNMIEVNPLVLTESGEFLALDAKINFDDNALSRHPDIALLYDETEESREERVAREHGFSYVSLNGNIGCFVNGAALAMATMDIIKFHGAEPANFLDIGGGPSKETVEKAFSLLLSDAKVRVILVNIFGGITKCDVVAEGIIAAIAKKEVHVPLIVRLEGTNVAAGKRLLEDSKLPIILVEDLNSAALKAVKALKAGA